MALVAAALRLDDLPRRGDTGPRADPAIWAAVQPPPGGVQPQGLSLDGMAYMRGWYPGDYDAINWMNEHIGGMPMIVEASGGVYEWYGRVSIYTGLPDVVQLGHEGEQRYGGQQPFGDQIGPRQQDLHQFWGTDRSRRSVELPDALSCRLHLSRQGRAHLLHQAGRRLRSHVGSRD